MRLLASAMMLASLLAGTAYAQSEFEQNGTRGQANAISIPTTVSGSLSTASGADLDDYFSFTAVAGSTYTFASNDNGSGFNPVDVGLEIQNGVGTVVAFKDDGGDNTDETLVWVAPSSGTFYLVVYEATNTPQPLATYNVNISVVSSVDDWSNY